MLTLKYSTFRSESALTRGFLTDSLLECFPSYLKLCLARGIKTGSAETKYNHYKIITSFRWHPY